MTEVTYYFGELRGLTVAAKVKDGVRTSFTENPDNADWQAFQEWLAKGNTPEPWPPAE